jgi:hypothetical protein
LIRCGSKCRYCTVELETHAQQLNLRFATRKLQYNIYTCFRSVSRIPLEPIRCPSMKRMPASSSSASQQGNVFSIPLLFFRHSDYSSSLCSLARLFKAQQGTSARRTEVRGILTKKTSGTIADKAEKENFLRVFSIPLLFFRHSDYSSSLCSLARLFKADDVRNIVRLEFYSTISTLASAAYQEFLSNRFGVLR